MVKHVSQFQLMMALQSKRGAVNLITLSKENDDVGLYVSGSRNSFGTTLMARGTREELEALVATS